MSDDAPTAPDEPSRPGAMPQPDAAQAPADDRPRSIALRHPTTRQTVRCLPDETEEWTEKGYEPVPHSGGHGNPPDPS